jgi:HSP20 family protein
MTNVQKRATTQASFDRLTEKEPIRVDEYRDGDVQVIRAEIPGVNLDKNVEINVHDGIVHISADRPAREKSDDGIYSRHELCYGSYSRRLPLRDGVTEADIDTSYKDGVLEIRVPVAK